MWHVVRLLLICDCAQKCKSMLVFGEKRFWNIYSAVSPVAKRTSVFDDPTMEIQELTAVVKQDITALNAAVVDLQLLCNSQNESGNISSDTTSHSTTVVDDLKNRLMSATKEFKDVLTMRTEVYWSCCAQGLDFPLLIPSFGMGSCYLIIIIFISWICWITTEFKGSWEQKAVIFFNCFKRVHKSFCSPASIGCKINCYCIIIPSSLGQWIFILISPLSKVKIFLIVLGDFWLF